VIAGEDEDGVGSVVLDKVQILVYGIGGASVPVPDGSTQIRLAQVNAAVLTIQVPRFANAYVGVEGVRPVLGENGYVEYPRIDTV
jgi:hypothetical protein